MSAELAVATQSAWHEQVRSYEARLLRSYLRKHRGHCGKTARALGLHRNTLTRLMNELQIDAAEIRKSFMPVTVRKPQSVNAIRREGEPTLRELIVERDPPLTKREKIDRMMYLASYNPGRRQIVHG